MEMLHEWVQYRNRVIFDTDMDGLMHACDAVLAELKSKRAYRLMAELAIDLRSVLADRIEGGDEAARVAAAGAQADRFAKTLSDLGENELAAYVKSETDAIQTSNLAAISRKGAAGALNNCWGNDNGLGIMNAMRRGGVFVTTNPPIIEMAIQACPEHYAAVCSGLKQAHCAEPAERLLARLAADVVYDNCLALRRIFEISGGSEGYAHYQVSPLCAADAAAMIDEALFVYDVLQERLGGTPNVLIKLPGTKAALKAAEELTRRGVGATITVNFSASQSRAFAQVMQKGSAPLNFVVVMSGRLDGPVCEELKDAGVADAEALSKNASRALIRRIQRDVLIKNGFDKTQTLVASLRGPWNIDASLTANRDSRIVISAFPDKWEQYDGERREAAALADVEPDGAVIERLTASAVFRSAYGLDALQAEDFDGFLPVARTLSSFAEAYRRLIAYVAQAETEQ